MHECISVGCVQSAAVAECLVGGVSAQGEGSVCLGGVSTQGVSAWGVYTPPVNRMTDRCKNITFPELRWRTVKML